MPNWLKHAGLIVGGAACIVVSVFFPPAAPVLGPVGTKLVLAGGGVTALALAEKLPSVIQAATKKS